MAMNPGERPTDMRQCLIDLVVAVEEERIAKHGLEYHRYPKVKNTYETAISDAFYRARMVLNPNYDPPDWWVRAKKILKAIREAV